MSREAQRFPVYLPYIQQMAECTRLLLAALLLAPVACRGTDHPPAADSSFAAVQRRGERVMGVDQYTSKHVFEDLAAGGRIVLDRDDPSDTAAIRRIREHMGEIERAFRRGDFSAPGLVHARDVPGTRVMSEKQRAITYRVVARPRGAELRIVSRDSAAVAAVHQFLAFQRADHRAAGHEGH